MGLLTQAGGRLMDHDLRHAFYNHLGQEAQRAGKEYKQGTAKTAYGRAYKALVDKGLAAGGSDGMVRALMGDQE